MIFERGDMVESVAIGRKKAFIGVIVSRMGAGWHVRCPEGRLWWRDKDDIKRYVPPVEQDIAS